MAVPGSTVCSFYGRKFYATACASAGGVCGEGLAELPPEPNALGLGSEPHILLAVRLQPEVRSARREGQCAATEAMAAGSSTTYQAVRPLPDGHCSKCITRVRIQKERTKHFKTRYTRNPE